MIDPLQVRLAQLAALGQTITYGALARDLTIPSPGAIAKLTAQLEALMDQDAAANRPLRAALCAGRLAGGMPAQGFFAKAAALGVFDGNDPAEFVQRQRATLYAR